MKQVAEGFEIVETYKAQKIILALVAPVMSLTQLQRFLPGVTKRMHSSARFWAKRYGPGAFQILRTPAQLHRTKTAAEERKIASFVGYISSPIVTVDLPFGTLNLKTSAGKVTIAATVRNMQVHNVIFLQCSFSHLFRGYTAL